MQPSDFRVLAAGHPGLLWPRMRRKPALQSTLKMLSLREPRYSRVSQEALGPCKWHAPATQICFTTHSLAGVSHEKPSP